jgi:hypothetical protein
LLRLLRDAAAEGLIERTGTGQAYGAPVEPGPMIAVKFVRPPRMEVNFVQLFGSHGKVHPRRWTGIDHAHG